MRGPGAGAGEKAKDFKGAIKRLIKELGKFKVLIIISLMLAILSSILSIFAPNKLSDLTDEIQKGLMMAMDMDRIKAIALFLTGLYLCSALFNYIQAICMTSVANNFARNLRRRISEKINKLPLKYFDKHQAGDTLSRVTNDVDTIAQTMNQSLASLVSSVTLFLGTIIMMFYTNWIMALTAILASLLGFTRNDYYTKKFTKIFYSKTKRIRQFKWTYRRNIFRTKCCKSI